MKLFQKFFIDQRFDEWASDQTLLAARILNQAAADLILQAEEDIANASWKDGLFDQNAFILDRIAPRIREVAEPLAVMIIEEANVSLAALSDMKAIWSRNVEPAPTKGNSFHGFGDIAAAIVPLGAGTATAVAIPTAAVTTTTAFFGLVTTTAISWPVVIGGGAVASLGIATGLIESGKVWSKVAARLRRTTRDFIVAALLKGTADHPSILDQLTAEFQSAASEARAAA